MTVLPAGFQTEEAARVSWCVNALWAAAERHDQDDADPAALCQPLVEHGLFVDALRFGVRGFDVSEVASLRRLLIAIGGANLSAGRLYEGHVNAIALVGRFGGAEQVQALARDVRGGAICGVWNAEAPPGLRIDHMPDESPGVLTGGKIFASGLGLVTRPLFTARTPDDEVIMLAPRFDAAPVGDLAAWRVRGMRATATGTVDFSGFRVEAEALIGRPNDYYRSPAFKGGAWRFAAVQTGAAAKLASLMRDELRARGRASDPHQKGRITTAAIAVETAQLWVERAATLAEDPAADPAAADAYVNLARLAVERACLDVVSTAERGLGLSAFTRPSQVDRVVRDLTTYLRQPFPDGAMEDAATYLVAAAEPVCWS